MSQHPGKPHPPFGWTETQLRLQPIAAHFDQLPKAKRAEAMMHAVAIEELRGERPPQDWLCKTAPAMRLEAIKRRMQAGQGQPAGGRRPVFTDAELDAALADVSIQFVPDENWRAAREGVIDHAIQHAASLLGDRPQQ